MDVAIVSLLSELRAKNPDLFKSDYRDPPYQTVEEKIERLALSEERVQELKAMPVEDYDGSYDLDDYNMSYEIIDVDKLAGFKVNHCVKNWYEALDSRVLHKPLTLEKYDLKHPEKFE